MCGIVGYINPAGFEKKSGLHILSEMRDELSHRGPDDLGNWVDEGRGIGLAHRRLSIIDRTNSGQQPMISRSGRHVIVFNGEIYNHRDIRQQLGLSNPLAWRGSSDTETLIESIEKWGLEDALEKLTGMYAFAIWDRQAEVLTLVRDRMGEKPLYYGFQNGTFSFASEIKALKKHPNFSRQLNHSAIPLYLQYGYIPAPWSVYKCVNKLPTGSYLKVKLSDIGNELNPTRYWSVLNAYKKGVLNNYIRNESDAVDELEKILSNTVSNQMMADVTTGALLSGGVDSTAIVAIMQAQSTERIKTFTIGFTESCFNEANHAKAIANYLGTDHSEYFVTDADAKSIIPTLASMFDEPFADTSAIPTHIVSIFARKSVSVVLTGDGGDEIFGGYHKYARMAKLYRRIKKIPYSLRVNFAKILRSLKVNKVLISSRKCQILETLLESRRPIDYYKCLCARWLFCEGLYDSSRYDVEFVNLFLSSVPEVEVMDVLQLADQMGYLPDNILCKVDRVSMAVSLETRAPLLDHNIVEWAWRLPQTMKVGDSNEKRILRSLVKRHVPSALIDRPKMGFGIPIGLWIKGPLRDWFESRILCTKNDHYLGINSRIVEKKWREHLDNKCDWEIDLWRVAMLKEWASCSA